MLKVVVIVVNCSQCEIKLGAILLEMPSVVENPLLEKRFSCCFLTPIVLLCLVSFGAASVRSTQLWLLGATERTKNC